MIEQRKMLLLTCVIICVPLLPTLGCMQMAKPQTMSESSDRKLPEYNLSRRDSETHDVINMLELDARPKAIGQSSKKDNHGKTSS
jgi:hypothetical protein